MGKDLWTTLLGATVVWATACGSAANRPAPDAGTQADAQTGAPGMDAAGADATAASAGPAYQAAAWAYLGGPLGGLGYDVRIDPVDPQIMYATDDGAGAFKSVDGGKTWAAINAGITFRVGPSGDGYSVFTLTIDPHDRQRLWIGSTMSSTVFRSDDAGAHWVKMGQSGISEQYISVRGLTVDPVDPDSVYMTGEVSSFEWNGPPRTTAGLDMTQGVVYRSTDAGQSWTRLWRGDNLTRHLLIDPRDTHRIWVATGIFDREAANGTPTDPGGVGILRSTDRGATWKVLGPANGLASDELYFGSLSQHPDDANTILAAAGNDPFAYLLGRPLGGIYRTQDGGDTWTEVLHHGNMSAVEFCRTDPTIAYAGAKSAIYRSDDGGRSWVQRTPGNGWGTESVVGGFPIDIECDPRDPERVFVNNYGGGNFVSDDGGATWQMASTGYSGARSMHVAVSRSDAARVFTTARSGIFGSDDWGATWHGLGYGIAHQPEGQALAVDPFDDTHLLASIGDAGPTPMVSHDRGRSWSWVEGGIAEAIGTQPVVDIVFSPHDRNLLFGLAGSLGCSKGTAQNPCEQDKDAGRVVVSRDGGTTWSRTTLPEGPPLSVAFAGRADGPILASIYGQGIFRSDDTGRSWRLLTVAPIPIPVENPDPDLPVYGARATVAVDPFEPQVFYAGLYKGGIAKSEDGGATWKPSSAGLDAESSILDLEVDPKRPGVLYAGSINSGVYVTTDRGEKWTSLNGTIPNRAVVRLALSGDGSVLYAAVDSAGVLRLGH